MIRALIFDWGGVIQRTEDYRPRQQLNAELGLLSATDASIRSVEQAVFGSEAFHRACIGELSADVAWHAIVTGLGYPAEQVDTFIERFFAGDRVDATLVQLIRALRAQGLAVGLLSNAPPGRAHNTSAAARWGMDGLFDAQVFSYEVGALKPDPRMYRAILAALHIAPEEAVFIDDAPANIEGARQIGIDAIQFTGVDALLDALAQRGIRPTLES